MDWLTTTAGCKIRGRRLRLLEFCALVLLSVLISNGVTAQDFGGTVTRDPKAGVATYDFHFDVPPSSPIWVSAGLLPLLDLNAVLPGLIAPPGWNLSIVIPPVPPAADFWSWDPLTDPKLIMNPFAYGPDPTIWVSPPAWLYFWASTPGDAVAPGTQLGGFQFQSPFMPTTAPGMYQDTAGQSYFVDPPTPDPRLPVAVPSIGPLGALLLGIALSYAGLHAMGVERRA